MLISGTTPSFIAISITGLAEGGPAMLASLIVVSSLFQFALAAWLPLLRRIITPVVSGTVFMLIAAILIPIAFDNLQQVPEGASLTGGLLSAFASMVIVNRDLGRLHSCRILRTVRHPASDPGALVWFP